MTSHNGADEARAPDFFLGLPGGIEEFWRARLQALKDALEGEPQQAQSDGQSVAARRRCPPKTG
jgi:hypothetical protein